ncbi:oligoribonuclease [Thiotrichales bacterium 19S9-12]|nr:oligoribonuclease [Thiotrichales bacterium 19S9-11]MCF6812424.1 oligoribonuclease [Thiotrichales bacterium 19S9-12]
MTDSNEIKSKRWIWIDLEMTGLDPETDRIIEIATVVTDHQLNVIAEGPVIAVSQSKKLLDQMDNWCTKTHGESGLTQRVLESRVSDAEAEQITLDFLKEHVTKNTSPMCGNSIWQDRRFLARYMPELESFFHYRMIDVSTLKILAKSWNPGVFSSHQKETKHLALDDVLDSIRELQHYQENFLKIISD